MLKILAYLVKKLLTFSCLKLGIWKLEPLKWLISVEKFGSDTYICLQRANIRQRCYTKEHMFSDTDPYGMLFSLSERVLIALSMTSLNTRVCMEGNLKENKNEVATWHHMPRLHSILMLLQGEEFVLLAKRWRVLDKIILYLEISGEQSDWQLGEKEKKCPRSVFQIFYLGHSVQSLKSWLLGTLCSIFSLGKWKGTFQW